MIKNKNNIINNYFKLYVRINISHCFGGSMYQRFRSMLTKPRSILVYLNDNYKVVLGYLLLLCAIITIPFGINVSLSKGLLTSEYDEINTKLNSIENFKGSIKDGILNIDNSEYVSLTFYNNANVIDIGRKSSPLNSSFQLSLSDDLIEIKIFGVSSSKILIKDISEDFEFSSLDSISISHLLGVINYGFNLSSYKVYSIGVFYFEQVIMYLIVSLILSFVLLLSNKKLMMPLRFRFKVGVYYATYFSIGVLIDQIIGSDYFEILGIIFSIVICIQIFRKASRKTVV
jgi:hypothetical protein